MEIGLRFARAMAARTTKLSDGAESLIDTIVTYRTGRRNYPEG
jgi:hypothetical protein